MLNYAQKKKKKLQPEGRSEILSAIIVTYNPWLVFFGGRREGQGADLHKLFCCTNTVIGFYLPISIHHM